MPAIHYMQRIVRIVSGGFMYGLQEKARLVASREHVFQSSCVLFTWRSRTFFELHGKALQLLRSCSDKGQQTKGLTWNGGLR
eukprot:5660982-Amphidinium_carterae.1